MASTRIEGFDFTLPAAPALRLPPLSLIDLCPSLIDNDQSVADRQAAEERLRSAQVLAEEAIARLADAAPEVRLKAQLAAEAATEALTTASTDRDARVKAIADLERWAGGFEWLPELGLGALEVVLPGLGTAKASGLNRGDFAWYDPFTVIGRDERSLFGLPSGDYDDRARRATRALQAHEPWQVEREFWTGEQVPTNWHLAASPATPTSTARRSIDAWDNPDAAPGTVLGTAVGLKQSLAALDQAIANSDAGVGMIHASPFVVQYWMSTFGYIRDAQGRVLTVNMNLLVPGYGYPGTGPDRATRSVTDAVTVDGDATVTSADANFVATDLGASVSGDGIPAGATIAAVTDEHTIELSSPATSSNNPADLTISGVGGDLTGATKQWAYATEVQYKCRSAVQVYPRGLGQASPATTVDNEAPVRAEREWAIVNNRLLRAAVLVDTATA